MKFDILSLFPNFFDSPLQESLIAKAIETKKLEIAVHNIRDFAQNSHKQVDDTPFGGGAGMVLKPDVLSAAVKSVARAETVVILTDPGGVKFDQKMTQELSKKQNLLLIAGRYEGVDQRFKDKYVDLEISIGDYILNGGEVAVLTIVEAVSRLIPGVIGDPLSLDFESFSEQNLPSGKEVLLEYPQYTRPAVFEGEEVPEVLTSGNHKEIQKWRLEEALKKTKKMRPDLLNKG